MQTRLLRRQTVAANSSTLAFSSLKYNMDRASSSLQTLETHLLVLMGHMAAEYFDDPEKLA